jgi:hypothetical protein
MPRQIPRRLIGYGAYNLCFDTRLGVQIHKPGDPEPPDTRNFFQYLKAECPPVNFLKVICFRTASLEGLPAGRTATLYNPDHTINPDFLANLDRLVGEADALGFWVQVCIFSYHNVALSELPENAPPEILPVGAMPCDRLKSFFTGPSAARRSLQKQVVRALGDTLKNRTNVIWELANEVRMYQDCKKNTPDNPDNREDLALAGWLNDMKNTLIEKTGSDIHVGTSTGIDNEATIARNLASTYFDFHGGQWKITGDYTQGIQGAKSNAHTYNPNAFLIINDDGILVRTEQKIRGWAGRAFQLGLHYNTKEPYPPGKDWSPDAFRALTDANNANP